MNNVHFKAMAVLGCDLADVRRRGSCKHNCCFGENCLIWLDKQFGRLMKYDESGLSPEEVQEFAKAKVEGRLVELPVKVGDPYTGICREMVPGKKGWKTKEWLDNGVVVGFENIAELTAQKAGYNHSRSIDEIGEAWFVGEGHHEAAEKALEELQKK